MPEGVIAGGWGYVIAAWGITAAVLIVYAALLKKRLRDAQREGGEKE